MTPVLAQSARAWLRHGRFDIEASLPDVAHARQVELVVRESESGTAVRLDRDEIMPLFHAIRQVLKAAEDTAACLPRDPVQRASLRVPVRCLPHALARGAALEAYQRDLQELRERHARRLEELARRIGDSPPGPSMDASPKR